jgi:hypothetical protein
LPRFAIPIQIGCCIQPPGITLRFGMPTLTRACAALAGA